MGQLDLRLVRSAIRCPYCHDAIDVAATTWVACRECLARHHEECWRSREACSTCGAAAPLAQAGPAERSLPIRRLEAEVALLAHDRAWEEERRRVHGRVGRDYQGSASTPFHVLCAVAIAGTVGTLVCGSLAAPAALTVVAGALACLASFVAKGEAAYESAKARSAARRAELVAERDAALEGSPRRPLPVV